MDKAALSIAVYERTGIAVAPDDPAFALVELNRLALEEAIEEAAGRLAQRLDIYQERIRAASTALATEVASQGVQRVAEMLREARQTIASDAERAQQRIAGAMRTAQPVSPPGASCAWWLLAGLVIGVLTSTGCFVAGELAAKTTPVGHSVRH